MSIVVSGISRRSATRFRVIRTDVPEPQLVAKGRRAPGLRRWTWNGRSGGKPVPAGVYVVQVRVRDRAGNIGSNPVRVPFDAGDSPGPAGITVRSLAAQPPLRPVTAGEKAGLLRRLARAAVPLGDPPRRRQAAGAPRQGRRRRQGSAQAARPARQDRPLPGRARVGPRSHRGAVPRAGARARDDARRRAGDHLARHRPGRRPAAARRHAGHARPRRRRARGLAARVRERTQPTRGGSDGRPTGFSEPDRAADALPRPQPDPLRPHERPRSRAVGLPARERPQGRAARGLAALGPAPARASPAPLRAGRRPARDVRAGDAAPQRDAARQRHRDGRPARAPDRADRHGPVRREARAGPPRRRRAAAHAARRRPGLRAVRGHRRHAGGVQRLRGVRAAGGGAARRRCSARWASSRRSPTRTRRPRSRRPRRATR